MNVRVAFRFVAGLARPGWPRSLGPEWQITSRIHEGRSP